MSLNTYIIVFLPFLFNLSWCDITVGPKETLVTNYPMLYRNTTVEARLHNIQTWAENFKLAVHIGEQAMRHIEAKYPHPKKQMFTEILSLDRQVVAGTHYRLQMNVGITNCSALSDETDCRLARDEESYKKCRVNLWVRDWTEKPASFRVTCDGLDHVSSEYLHHIQAEQLFIHFLARHSPSYINNLVEKAKRFAIFKENIKKMHELNVHEKGTATYGVTHFADLTHEEFRLRQTGEATKTRSDDENEIPMRQAQIPNKPLPENFDWRNFGAVTPVKDQGMCGGCWAFSIAGNVESLWKIKSGNLISLSEQELIDCDEQEHGCQGGIRDRAYRVLEALGGLEAESDYPFKGVQGNCKLNKTLTKVQIHGAINITSNETGMALWLMENGPISTGLNPSAMQFYKRGISHPWPIFCDRTELHHDVLIVGFGGEVHPVYKKYMPYWIIKNSWGPKWGEQGYYRLYRGDGSCGVNLKAYSAVL